MNLLSLFTRFCPDNATLCLTANALLQIAVVAALSWLLSVGVARHRPALCHGIWLSALLCVLLSPAASYVAARAGLSLISLRLLPRPASAEVAVVQTTLPVAADTEQLRALPDRLTVERVHNARPDVPPFRQSVSTPDTTAAGSASVAPPPANDPLRAALGMVTLLWTSGTIVLLTRLVYVWSRIARLQRCVQPDIDDRLQAVLPEVRHGLNVEVLPRLGILPRGAELPGPITVGLLDRKSVV
jgi:hypothetical protein